MGAQLFGWLFTLSPPLLFPFPLSKTSYLPTTLHIPLPSPSQIRSLILSPTHPSIHPSIFLALSSFRCTTHPIPSSSHPIPSHLHLTDPIAYMISASYLC
ncbi:hypothetical protein M430DRAFT_34022 [Amorphotheca resinae ATCC 22711]|uniref:REJ domain-containing protein n=1 Tax=Amorphotheca resinae ATCC 22711 TaxID=857342 RepID=A0A2T3B5E6_AMORE|nr:hypothetical protein M430DRAFT_34022 [Amorphotheca resinae ATCC 22711]PSS21984.1 hypothetical protein M430DRAFT_34022 [Amorphotheca resinae ATCC 22711]